MSLETLLEAARFLELQEARQQLKKTAVTEFTSDSPRQTKREVMFPRIDSNSNLQQRSLELTPDDVLVPTSEPTSRLQGLLLNGVVPKSSALNTYPQGETLPSKSLIINDHLQIGTSFCESSVPRKNFCNEMSLPDVLMLKNSLTSPTQPNTQVGTLLPVKVPKLVNQINCEAGNVDLSLFKIEPHDETLSNELSTLKTNGSLPPNSPTFDSSPQDGLSPLSPSLTSSPNDGEHRHKRTREVHNKLERRRRSHLSDCFKLLRSNLPTCNNKKCTNLGVLHNAVRYIQSLRHQEKEMEHEIERLAREKISAQQRLRLLEMQVTDQWNCMDFSTFLRRSDGSNHSRAVNEPQSTPTIDQGSEVSSAVSASLNNVGYVYILSLG